VIARSREGTRVATSERVKNAAREAQRTLIVTATLGAIAVCVGQGSSQLAASALFDLPTFAASTAAPEVPRADRPLDGCAVLAAHPFFDSALVLNCDEEAEPSPPRAPASEASEPPPCAPSVRLVGAYVRRGAGAQSFAAITSSAGASLLYREGMSVDGHTVVAIRESSVLLAADTGAQCTIAMFGDDPGPRVAMLGAAVVTPVLDTRPSSSPDVGSHVERLAESRYAIDRSFIDDVLARRAWPAASILPEERDGRTVGMRVYGVSRSGLLAQLGIENGDSIRTINGYDLTDPIAAMEALAQLRRADHLTLSLARHGTPMAIEYEIR
jgi:general secretion pathway protein C